MANTAPAATEAPTPPAANANGAPTPPAAATAEPTQDFIVNGKPVKLTAAQVKQYVQKGYFADAKLKSMDVLQNKTASLLEALKTPEGLIGILKDPAMGASPKEVLRKLLASDLIDEELKEDIAKWTYERVVKPAKQSPEEQERDKKLSDYERLKQAEDARKKTESEAAEKARVGQVQRVIRAEVSKAILADKTFPQTEGSVRAVFEKLRVMNRKGVAVTSESIGKAVELVKKDHVLHQQAILDAIEDPEALISAIGEARALKISKALVARLQAKAKTDAKDAAKAPEGRRERVTERIQRQFGKEKHGYTVLDV